MADIAIVVHLITADTFITFAWNVSKKRKRNTKRQGGKVLGTP
jgi:hypothetical protein